MKRKFIVYHESGLDETGRPKIEELKIFKNEPEAVSFINDDRNVRHYGTMYLEKVDKDGTRYDWEERHETWQLKI